MGKQKYQMSHSCKLCFVNLAKDESPDHDSKNCSETSAMTWFRIFSRFVQILIFVFFTPPYHKSSLGGAIMKTGYCENFLIPKLYVNLGNTYLPK